VTNEKGNPRLDEHGNAKTLLMCHGTELAEKGAGAVPAYPGIKCKVERERKTYSFNVKGGDREEAQTELVEGSIRAVKGPNCECIKGGR